MSARDSRSSSAAKRRKQSVEATQFSLLVQSDSAEAIFLLDADGCIATWNPGAERIKGYREEEIIGRHLSVLYVDEDRRAGKPERALRVAAEAGRYEDEGWRRRKDGSRFWAEMTLTALRDSEGRLTGFAKITRDRTQRRISEALLEGQRDLLTSLCRTKCRAISE